MDGETDDLVVTDEDVNTYSSHYWIAYEDDKNVPARGREAIRSGIAAVLAQRQLRRLVGPPRSVNRSEDAVATAIICCVEEKNTLRATIRSLEEERDGLLAWKRSVDEALNSGDGSYRP